MKMGRKGKKSQALVSEEILENYKNGNEKINSYLNGVLQNIRVGPPERNGIRDTAISFQDYLLEEMCESDELFRKMYNGKKITGSVKKRLKVEKPNEYDVNVFLQLPFLSDEDGEVEIDHLENYPGSYKISFPIEAWKWPLPKNRLRRCWKNLFFHQEQTGSEKERVFLRADSVRKWMQGVVHRVLKKSLPEDEKLSNIRNIKESRSGPAITIIFDIMKDGIVQENISIDLVPCIIIPEYAIPTPKDEGAIFEFMNKIDKDFHLVPAPPKKIIPKFTEICDGNTFFRGTFPTYEENMISATKCLKDVIRILKVVRNDNDWKPLASFHIMNACFNWRYRFLQERKKGESDVEHLQSSDLYKVFLGCLKELEKSIREHHLPMTLFKECNLIEKLNPGFCEECSNRLGKIIRMLERALKENTAEIDNVLNLLFINRKGAQDGK